MHGRGGRKRLQAVLAAAVLWALAARTPAASRVAPLGLAALALAFGAVYAWESRRLKPWVLRQIEAFWAACPPPSLPAGLRHEGMAGTLEAKRNAFRLKAADPGGLFPVSGPCFPSA